MSIIKVDNVTFSYPGINQPALKNLSFEIEAGTWTAIVGHNGSGKSTLVKLLDGLHFTNTGKIIIDDLTLNQNTVWDVRVKVGLVFQNPEYQFVGATVADDVAFGLENIGIDRELMIKEVNDALDKVGMLQYKDAAPSQLSGGQKQRVALAGILALKPKIIILDEATSMLDYEARHDIMQLVKQLQAEGITILSITHDPDELVYADKVMVLDQGSLLDDFAITDLSQKIDKLEQLGLTVPFVFQLMKQLRAKGLNLPDYINDEKALVNYLCQLHSKM